MILYPCNVKAVAQKMIICVFYSTMAHKYDFRSLQHHNLDLIKPLCCFFYASEFNCKVLSIWMSYNPVRLNNVFVSV